MEFVLLANTVLPALQDPSVAWPVVTKTNPERPTANLARPVITVLRTPLISHPTNARWAITAPSTPQNRIYTNAGRAPTTLTPRKPTLRLAYHVTPASTAKHMA